MAGAEGGKGLASTSDGEGEGDGNGEGEGDGGVVPKFKGSAVAHSQAEMDLRAAALEKKRNRKHEKTPGRPFASC